MKTKLVKKLSSLLCLLLIVQISSFSAFASSSPTEDVSLKGFQDDPSFSSFGEASALATSQGFLRVEAEDLENVSDRFTISTGESWANGASGKHLTSTEKDDTEGAPLPSSYEADIAFTATADESGNYFLWARTSAQDTGGGYSRSIALSANDSNYLYKAIPFSQNNFEWRLLETISDVSENDEISLRIRKRHSRIALDQFILTSDSSFVPTGIDGGYSLQVSHFTTSGGYLRQEIEQVKNISNRFTLATASDWASDPSGRFVVSTSGDDTVPTPELPETPADILFEVTADRAGTYSVWLRTSSAPSSGYSRSLTRAFNGGNYEYAPVNQNKNNCFTWTKVGTVMAGANEDFSVALRKRHSELAIDQFLITNDAQLIPFDINGDPDIPPSNSTFLTVEGSVLIEAESLVVDSSNYKVVTDKEDGRFAAASGNAGLMAYGGTYPSPMPSSLPASTTPDIDVSVEVDEDGPYFIWIRTAAKEGSWQQSVYVSTGGDYASTYRPENTEGSFLWGDSAIASAQLNAGDILSFRLKKRHQGQLIDKIIITNNFSYRPEGLGEPPTDDNQRYPLPGGAYPIPTILPPSNQHPRLLLTPSNIPEIRANLTSAQNQEAYQEFLTLSARNESGMLPALSSGQASNYSKDILKVVEAKAFDYAVNGNTQRGTEAVQMMKNILATANFDGDTFETRVKGHAIFTASLVYDWCYPLMDDEERSLFVLRSEMFAMNMEMGWPPSKQGSVSGHGSEMQLMRDFLSLAVASYDEYPDIYEYVAGRFFDEFIEPRDFYNQSSSYHQGNAYGPERYIADMFAANIIKAFSGEDVFSADAGQVPYELLYIRRPDGQTFRLGDDFIESGTSGYYTQYAAPLFYAANYYDDSYLKQEYFRSFKSFDYGEGFYTPTLHLILNNPNLDGESNRVLPKTRYFSSPNGMMVARTGWNDGTNAPDVMALMKIGEVWGGNHDHLDAGSFQLYYKGALASESGWYESYGTAHDGAYNKRSIAHNVLTIYDPNEPEENYKTWYDAYLNDGGQFWPAKNNEAENYSQWSSGAYDRAKVLGAEYGPNAYNPAYTYIKGDLTPAYYSGKVDEVLRSMVFLPLEDTNHPAVMLVMDKVTATDPNFKKSYLLHVQEEPEVVGNKTIVTRTERDYSGRMVMETLLPANPTIEVIGGSGKEFWVDGQNLVPDKSIPTTNSLEAGWGRIEVSPSTPNKTDFFLHVMTVSDAGTTVPDLESTLLETEDYVGATIANQLIIFAKNSERLTGTISIENPLSETSKVLVAGIENGTWTVTHTGGTSEVIVTEAGGVAYFEAPEGTITLTYKNGESDRDLDESNPPIQQQEVLIRLNGKISYCSFAKPYLQGNEVMVPLELVSPQIGVQCKTTGNRVTAVFNNMYLEMSPNSSQAKIDGSTVTMSTPATYKDGVLMIPASVLKEVFSMEVIWLKQGNVLDIRPGKLNPPIIEREGYATIVDSTASEYSEQFFDTNSWDNDLSTLWSAQGAHWVQYTLKQTYHVTGVEIIVNQNAHRNALFEILVSTDGVNFTSLYDGLADGTVGNGVWEAFSFEETEAKYIRYLAKGSNISAWNGLVEFRALGEPVAPVE